MNQKNMINSFETESNLNQFCKSLYYYFISSTLPHEQADFNQYSYKIDFQNFISILNYILTEFEIDNTIYNDVIIHNDININIENNFTIQISQHLYDYQYQRIETEILNILDYIVSSNDFENKYTILNTCNQFDYLNILNKDKICKICNKMYEKIN